MVTTWNEPLAKPKDAKERRAQAAERARAAAAAPLSFDIHIDDELAQEEEEEEEGGASSSPVPMRLQLAGPSLLVSKEIEALQTHPLARFVAASDEPKASAPAAHAAPADENARPAMNRAGNGAAPFAAQGPSKPAVAGGGGGFTIFDDSENVFLS